MVQHTVKFRIFQYCFIVTPILGEMRLAHIFQLGWRKEKKHQRVKIIAMKSGTLSLSNLGFHGPCVVGVVVFWLSEYQPDMERVVRVFSWTEPLKGFPLELISNHGG